MDSIALREQEHRQLPNWLERGSAKDNPDEPRKITEARRAAGLGWHELADQIAASRSRIDPGIAFARKQQEDELPWKEEARERVLTLFDLEGHPHDLTILTMPGAHWRFEYGLLQCRPTVSGRPFTRISAIERNEATFRLGLRNMPGRGTARRRTDDIVVLPTAPYATATVSTTLIQRYHRCAFEDLAYQANRKYNGAWLDFNGPLSTARLRALRAFWRKNVTANGRVILTVLDGRYDALTGEAIQKAGGVLPWLTKSLPAAEVLESCRYAEPAAMLQIALHKMPDFDASAPAAQEGAGDD